METAAGIAPSHDKRESVGPRRGGCGHPVLAILAGGLSVLGFAPHGLWPITILALAWMLHSIVKCDSWIMAWTRGWLFGLAHFALGLSWLPTAFSYQDAMPDGWGWPALLLLASYLAIYPATAFAAARFAGGQSPLRVVFLSGSCWILAEWLRGTLFSGFPWNPVGIIWLDLPYVSRTPAYVGSIGLSGLTVLLAGSLTLTVARRLKAATTAVSPFAILIMFAGMAAPSPLPLQTPVRATVVQPDISQGEKWRPTLAQRHLETHMALSGQQGSAERPRILFWPEAAVPYPIETDANLRQHLARLLGPRDLLLTGGTATVEGANGERHATNSVFVLDSGGRILFRYDKGHLVPFGEYLPFEPFLNRLGLGRLTEGSLAFEAGTGPTTLDLPGLPSVGPSICYEIIFPGDVASLDRPSFLFNPSNDAWFGRWGPPQHLAHARMRSIEEGLPTVRATTSGISALIDPDGRVLAEIPAGRQGYIDAPLPQPHPPTWFARNGNLIPLAISGILTFALVAFQLLRGFYPLAAAARGITCAASAPHQSSGSSGRGLEASEPPH